MGRERGGEVKRERWRRGKAREGRKGSGERKWESHAFEFCQLESSGNPPRLRHTSLRNDTQKGGHRVAM